MLGVAFKPDSDDVRDSPALDVIKVLHDLGAHITVYDPAAMDRARHILPEVEYARSVIDAAYGADMLLLLTEWREFREADPEVLGKAVAHRKMADGRNTLDPVPWLNAGWEFRALGRP